MSLDSIKYKHININVPIYITSYACGQEDILD
jgi:hypothetical protein